MAEVLCWPLAIEIVIPRWNRVSGETESHFKKRFYADCERAVEEHIRDCKRWTSRSEFAEFKYIDGLALWQADAQRSLAQIRESLQLHVGSENDVTGISKGLDSAAAFIGIDRR